MLDDMRSLAWRKDSNARAVYRLTGSPVFVDAVKSASPAEKRVAYKLIEEGKIDELQDWVRAQTRTYTTADLKVMASQLGIPRYSRMDHETLRKAVERETESRATSRSTSTSGHEPRRAVVSGLQTPGGGVQSKEVGQRR